MGEEDLRKTKLSEQKEEMRKRSSMREDAEKLTTMVSGLCNLQHRIKDMMEKMKEMMEMNRSGFATATRINEFQERLDQLQYLLTQDLYKTGEVARCQHRLINDIECFKDILRNEEKTLKEICADVSTTGMKGDCQPYTSPSGSTPQRQPEFNITVPSIVCPPADLQPKCYEQSNHVTEMVNNFDSMEDDNAKLTDLFISELNPMGKFIIIKNGNSTKATDIGGYALCQQTEDGCFFYMFRFPLRTCIEPNSQIKIWAACYDPGLCKSPADFVASGIMRWAFCPDVITKVLNNCETPICWIKGAK